MKTIDEKILVKLAQTSVLAQRLARPCRECEHYAADLLDEPDDFCMRHRKRADPSDTCNDWRADTKG